LSLRAGKNIVGGDMMGGNAWLLPNGTGFSQVTPALPNDPYICDKSYVINGSNVDHFPLKYSSSFLTEYTVSFVENGLPEGATWSVTLNGTTESSTSNSITFKEPNGNYYYAIGSVNGYSASPSSGSMTVNGANVEQGITFTAVKTPVNEYAVTFTESGLASGTQWSVTLNGVTKSSTNSTITFMVPPGNYTYTVSSVSGYKASQSTGTVSVSASSVSAPVALTYTAVTTPTTAPKQGQSTLITEAIVIVIIAIAVVALILRRRK